MNSETTPLSALARQAPAAERALGLLMKRVLQSISAQADRRLAAHGLTHAQWLPLLKLHQGECATVAALAREMDMDPGAMTRALDRLETKGLVQRIRSCTDRRVVNLALTPQGERVATVVPGVLTEVIGKHLVGFSEVEVEALLKLLNRMLDNGSALRCAVQESLVGHDAAEPQALASAPSGRDPSEGAPQ